MKIAKQGQDCPAGRWYLHYINKYLYGLQMLTLIVLFVVAFYN